MLLIIVLGQIVTSALVSGECDYGSTNVTDFDWNKVGIGLLTLFLQQAVVNTSACVYISFVVILTNSQQNISDCTFEYLNYS